MWGPTGQQSGEGAQNRFLPHKIFRLLQFRHARGQFEKACAKIVDGLLKEMIPRAAQCLLLSYYCSTPWLLSKHMCICK